MSFGRKRGGLEDLRVRREEFAEAGGQFVLLIRLGLLGGVGVRLDRSGLEFLVPGRKVIRMCGAHESGGKRSCKKTLTSCALLC